MAEPRQITAAANRMRRPIASVPAASAGITPKEAISILRRHMILIVSSTILGLLVGGVSWFLLLQFYPRYTAQTFIRVLPPLEKDPTRIGSPVANKDIQYGYRLSIADLIKQQSSLMNLLSLDKVKQTDWYKNFGESESVRIQKAFSDLKKNFSAEAQRDAEFVTLSMTCGTRQEAAVIVNQLVDLFIGTQGETKRREVAERMARLEDQRIRLQSDLNAAETALQDVRERWNLTRLERRNYEHTITLKLNDLEIEQNNLLLEIKQLQSIVENLERQATGPINEQIENQIETDPIMVTLAQQLALQEAQLKGKLTKFGENHRVVRETQELINEIKRKREKRRAEIAEQTRQSNLQNAEDQLVVLSDRFEELEKMRQEAEARQRELDLARIQYEQRLATRDERKERLNEVLESINKLRMLKEAPDTPKVQFIGYAPEPLVISFPKWQMFFPGGTILGLVVGIALSFLIEFLNDLVRTPRDVARYLRVRLLGVVPNVNEDPQAKGVELYHIARLAPYSIISESYRRLRTNLKLSGASESSKVLLISSGGPEEGKTSVAVNLATTLVAEDKKVLLIDANFRRPSLDKIFPVSQESKSGVTEDNEQENASEQQGGPSEQPAFGLSTMLTGLCGYQQIIRSSAIEGLDIIDSGPVPPDPAELLGAEQMHQLLKRQRGNYDYIIIDSPPVLLVSDSKMLAKFADGTILVFSAKSTRRGAAIRTIRELREVDAKLIGCVLIAVRALKGGYFREQFRSYQEYQKMQLAHSM